MPDPLNPEAPSHPDFVGRSEYRVDAGFVVGYVILFAGLLMFGWDARYLFLGVAIELALAILGYQVQSLIAARGLALVVSLIMCAPALLIALLFAAFPLISLIADGLTEWTESLGLLVFIGTSVHSNCQRIRRTTLRVARFYRYLNEKYVYEDGKPVFGGVSLVMGSVSVTWLTTIVFCVSYVIATEVGMIFSSQGAGLTMAILCLLRQLAVSGIVRAAYRNRPDQEAFWLEQLSHAGKVVLKDESSLAK